MVSCRLATSVVHRINIFQFPFLTSSVIHRRLATTHHHSHQSILSEIHPQHLYQIINNVDQYQHFLPYCLESKILRVSPCGTMMDAVLRVGLPLGSSSALGTVLEERYVSRVRMIPPSCVGENSDEQVWIVEAKSIQSNLLDSLKSRWRLSVVPSHQCNAFSFGDAGNIEVPEEPPNRASCNVKFDVEIQVSNPIISFTLDKVLKDVARKQVDAFERRCRDEPFDGIDVDLRKRQ
eukprot:CCRYP_015528-RA/>CCRYP_015528-RA protein AED:0.23 eAED:0.23 QI:0/-1/0/1/-1/1/1/0/234